MTPDRWQQIDALLDLALEQEPSRRASFLAEACNGDEALRQEVEALLAAHDQAGSFLVSPTSEAAAQGVVEAQTPSLAGQVIGPYQILSVLGKGGMGEVYLAQDSRLGRKIALKLLPSQFAQDRDHLRRFEREARAASALNHPNILTVYEIGEQGGNIFIATEFIEGQTLRQRIAGGPLKLLEVLDVAVQVASGLGAAHAAGIVHRDIKPENIMLRRDGLVKVLDFGLAKLSERPAAIGGAQDAKAYWSETETGVLMGTTRYMSPEQARGLKLDARTDLFSLGVLMYEMVAGRPPFEGKTATDVIIAIVETEPSPLSQLAEVPMELEKIVIRTLSKNPEARYQTATEIESDLKRLRRRLEIEADSEGRVAPGKPKVPTERIDGTVGGVQKRPLRALWAKRLGQRRVALLVLVSTVSSFLVIRLRSPLPAPTILNTIQITNDRQPKFGPLLTDGARVYFNEELGGRRTPVCVSTNGAEAVPIPMSLPDARVLDISPQGSELLVASGGGPGVPGALWVLPLLAGTARRLGDFEAPEATWSPDGEKLIYIKENDLYLAKSDGTESRKLVSMPGHPFFLRWAPDGKRLTVSVEDPQGGYNQLWELSADGSNLHPRFPGWSNPPPDHDCSGRWTPDGKYFLFDSYRGGPDSIWAIREKRSLFEKASREPVRLTTGPMDTGKPLPSKDGKRVFFFGVQVAEQQLMRYDSKLGEWLPYLSGISGEQVDFSRDGQWITYVSSPEANLIRSKADGSQRLQLTSPPLKVSKPRWSPDGKRIAFMAKTPDKPWKIYVALADGGTAQPLIPGDVSPGTEPSPRASQARTNSAEERDPDWSPDGSSLVFVRQPSPEEKASNAMTIHILDLRTNQVRRLAGSGDRFYPRWSPDGRYLAATADGCKRVVLFDFKTRNWVELARGDVYNTTWSRDGQSVYFIDWTQQTGKRGYYRVGIHNRSMERLTDLGAPIEDGTDGGWVGLAPDDSPIALLFGLGVGSREIYAFDWEAP